jgi:hypothetical protein
MAGRSETSKTSEASEPLQYYYLELTMFRPSRAALRALLTRLPHKPREASSPHDAFSGLLKSNSNVFIHGVAVSTDLVFLQS